ncbi:MAG: ABC transporter ATP-binding protein [Deferribacteres bacterium]|nr:ABC transporter ATP-binding protein [Deferribacteres bacterium]
MTDVILQVEDLETGYGEVQILWGVSLKAYKSKLTTIIGSNGSGKTTLLRAITGVLPIWKGRVIFEGKDITKLPAYKRAEMGLIMVPEGRMVFPEMTVYENLEMGAYTKRARKKMKETMEFVFSLFPRLKERINQKAGTMSGGEQQMLAIGRGLMALPELLILDEPSLGLAPKLVLEVFEIIERLRSEGVTMLLVEQNVHLSLAITDYAYVMAEGRIVMEGTGKELAESDEVRKAYLGI